MSINVSFELSENDLEHFRALMKVAIEKASALSEQEILEKASALCKEMESANVPDFVTSRLRSLELLVESVKDEEWQMPEDERKEILTSLAYFAEPHDLVPDNIPGLGYVDDAIMIELVIQDMSLDLEAYQSFCSFRRTEENRRGDGANVNRESWLAAERSELRSRLRRNRSTAGRRRVFSRIM
ncbi:YkvA family protein [Aestuariibacter salexigens]|uniref:YkvA family protein n=1 Tax=Aestuariibacter salexigens TaxID=226010 RepID=UPI0003FE9120|nr:YkvA family protein [Aestuariibacter salexigens]